MSAPGTLLQFSRIETFSVYLKELLKIAETRWGFFGGEVLSLALYLLFFETLKNFLNDLTWFKFFC